MNTDFDALASMLAAKKLYPDAQVVISDKQSIAVRQFLTIYRDALDLVPDHLVDWDHVTELILVDEASLTRIGDYAKELQEEKVKITVYDHHPPKKGDVDRDDGVIELVGAAVTLFVEEMREQSISISPFEATLFGLGIYTDTGSFTYNNTTARDFQAASYLMEHGMNLEVVQRFSDEMLLPEQQKILNHLFQQVTPYYIDGLQVVVSTYQHKTFQKGLATITQKLLEITDADAVLTVVAMKNRVYVVGRASSERINLLPLLKKWHGGGHQQAGSATIKESNCERVSEEVIASLDLIVQPAITARDMMTSPVKTISPDTSIEESGKLMYRYGHSGFPVVKDDKLLGMITRRDLEKANHHGLGHAPVKAYMGTNVVSIKPETPEEEIQRIIIERNIGRLPVLENGQLIGIVSRTNIIESLHKQRSVEDVKQPNASESKDNLQTEMKEQLPEDVSNLLEEISLTAKVACVSVYLIGGIVRDILLGVQNDDIDIVVEGNGVTFTRKLQADSGGNVKIHDNFGTATWTHPTGLEIDITSSRLEYYDRPAALPDVESSTVKEDLYRRDFTINAMALNLNEETYGQLVDPFHGRLDLQEKRIKVLHNLSFIEDPTRILRGVRFETRFQFFMDKQTEKLALHSIERVKDLSANRVVDEMEKLFAEANPGRSMKRLFELQFWQQYGVKDTRNETSCQHADSLCTLYLDYLSGTKPCWFSYFVIPFYAEGNLDTVKEFALTKKASKFLKELLQLNDLKQWQSMEEVGGFQRFLKDYSDEAILFVVSNKSLVNKEIIVEYVQSRHHLPTLLTGEDLIKHGLKPGRYFSEILLELEVAMLNGEIKTKGEATVWLQRHISELF